MRLYTTVLNSSCKHPALTKVAGPFHSTRGYWKTKRQRKALEQIYRPTLKEGTRTHVIIETMSEYYDFMISMVSGKESEPAFFVTDDIEWASFGDEYVAMQSSVSGSGHSMFTGNGAYVAAAGVGVLLVLIMMAVKLIRYCRGRNKSNATSPSSPSNYSAAPERQVGGLTAHLMPARMALKVVGIMPCWVQKLVCKVCRLNCWAIEKVIVVINTITAKIITAILFVKIKVVTVAVLFMLFFARITETTEEALRHKGAR